MIPPRTLAMIIESYGRELSFWSPIGVVAGTLDGLAVVVSVIVIAAVATVEGAGDGLVDESGLPSIDEFVSFS